MPRGTLILTFLALCLTGCAPEFVRTDSGEDVQRIPIASLASRLSLEWDRDPSRQVEILSDEANDVLLCAGMKTIRINDAFVHLSAPVLATGAGITVPEDAEGIIRSRLVTIVPLEPKPPTPVPPPTIRKKLDWRLMPTPPVPRSWRVRADRQWTAIVIHHSATDRGCASLFDRQHREENKWQYGLGYHFVIGNGTDTRDGEVEVGHRWTRQNEGIHGAHAGDKFYNQHGIGICLVGNFETGRPTERQMAALYKLVRKLCARYGIPTSRIYRHGEVRPESTDCPGRYFPFDTFVAGLRSPS